MNDRQDFQPARVLVTGFGPFGKNASNPTSELVRTLQEKPIPGVVAQVLPVEFVAGPARLRELIDRYRPELVLCTGLAAGSTALRVERIAVNERAGRDEAGIEGAVNGRRTRLEDSAESPDGRFATLDTDALLGCLRSGGLAAEESWHAGTFVCNAVLWEAITAGIPAGFLHVPADVDVPTLVEALSGFFGAAGIDAVGQTSGQ